MTDDMLRMMGSRKSLARERARRGRRRIPLVSLRMRVSERVLLLLVVDLVAVNVALLFALVLRSEFVFSLETLQAFYYRWFVTLSIVWLVCALFFDTYDLARAASTVHSVRNSGAAALTTVLIYILVPFVTPSLRSRSMIFVFAALAMGFVVAWRVLYAQLFVQPWFTQRAIVVGAGRAGKALAAALKTAPADANPFRGTGYILVGFVDDDPSLLDSEVEGLSVLGGCDALGRLARQYHVDEVIMAITHRHAITDELYDALLRCRELGLRVTAMSTLYERLLGRVPVQHVGRDLHLVVPDEDTAIERLYRVSKQVLDLLSALVGIVVLGLVTPLVALGNVLSAPGPLFYRQRRVGRGGSTFEMLKFRSMIPDAEEATGAVWACRGDGRVTPMGRFLRRTRLDELPQFINVLRGEMSLIGPRPERPEFVAGLAKRVPFYRARHAVRPGITGWAQVQYPYGNSEEDATVKLEYDLYYVKHTGFLLDLRILLQTVWVVLRSRGY